MAAQLNTDTVALQLEKVRDKLPLMYERDNVLLNIIQTRGDVEKVSTRSMRVPLQMSPGGKAGQATMDGDDLGRGGGTRYEVATLSPLFFRFGVEITKLVEFATNASEKAIENAAKKEVKNGMAQFRAFLDKLMQTSGNGVLGTVSTGASGVTWTMANPNGAQLFYKNQDVSLYDVTLATKRGETTITAINFTTGVITVSPAIGTGINGDAVLPSGVTGANPASLFGIKYHQNNSTTGTWQGLTRASFNEVLTPRVNGLSGAITPGYVRLALNLIAKALGVEAAGQLMAYTNVDQMHAWENIGLGMSQIIRSGSDKQPDQLFTGVSTVGGCKAKASINADPTRWDFLDLTAWGRAEIAPIDFYEIGKNQTVFPVYGASGGIASAYLFYFVTGFQVFNENPRKGSFIDSLARPSGYPVFA